MTLVPGTLNLCANRPVELLSECVSLAAFHDLALPQWRRDQPGFDPRLYLGRLAGSQTCWLYRWSAPSHLTTFVGEADGCPPAHRCEIVAEVKLRDALELTEGSLVTLELL